MTIYEVFSYFYIYAFVGWCTEVISHVLKDGIIVNRGYLNGPLCPIYGFGMLSILLLLQPVRSSGIALFFGGMFLATFIELIGGWILFRFFKMRWWDYSKEPFNLGGFICARYAVAWGLGTVIIMNMIHPFAETLVKGFPHSIGIVILVLFSLTFVSDCIATTLTVMKMIEKFERIDRLASSIRERSDMLTERIGEKTLKAEEFAGEKRLDAALAKAELIDKAEAFKDKLDEKKAEAEQRLEQRLDDYLDELEQKQQEAEMEYNLRLDEYIQKHNQLMEELRSHKLLGSGRILKVFPNLEERFKNR